MNGSPFDDLSPADAVGLVATCVCMVALFFTRRLPTVPPAGADEAAGA